MGVRKFEIFLWVIVSVVQLIQPHSAFGSRRLINDGAIVTNPPPLGICPSTVLKYGYKCQEIDVRIYGRLMN